MSWKIYRPGESNEISFGEPFFGHRSNRSGCRATRREADETKRCRATRRDAGETKGVPLKYNSRPIHEPAVRFSGLALSKIFEKCPRLGSPKDGKKLLQVVLGDSYPRILGSAAPKGLL